MNPLVIARARLHGIKQPILAWREADNAGIPYWAACAFLMQESGGGENVFGHDGGTKGWASGWGVVTEIKYLRYLVGRLQGKGNQGVGPMQLTHPSLQDEADLNGGCWKPAVNMQTAFEYISELRATEGNWHDVALRYNGSESYADQMVERFAEWRQNLKVRD